MAVVVIAVSVLLIEWRNERGFLQTPGDSRITDGTVQARANRVKYPGMEDCGRVVRNASEFSTSAVYMMLIMASSDGIRERACPVKSCDNKSPFDQVPDGFSGITEEHD